MYGQISTLAFIGVEARPVEVQVRITPGRAMFSVVGLPDKAVAESRERVRNATLPLAAMTYLGKHLPDPATHRIYSDRGDDWLDSLYAPTHRFLAEVLRDRGYTAVSAMTAVIDGTGHSEADWAARLETPLRFIMGKP